MCTVADELEFDSWPEEQKKLAFRVLGEPETSNWNDGYNSGYARGYQVGLARGRRDKTS